MEHILRMRPDAAENAEHGLDEEGWLDDAAIGEMAQCIEMADVIALDFEAGAVLGAGLENVFDIREGVLEDTLPRAFEVRTLPLRFERAVALDHGIEPKIHGTHVEGGNLRLEHCGRAHPLLDGHGGGTARRDVDDAVTPLLDHLEKGFECGW